MSYQDNNLNKSKSSEPRRNEYIRLPQVQLITESGENIGTIDTDEARRMAKEAGLDLVEVSSNVRPPVCKIMDYSKYIYQQNKKKKKSKTKELKEFRFSPVIDDGDMLHRINRAKQFIEKGHPVKITMQRKGRQSTEQAKEVFDEILTNFEDYCSIETEPKYEGRRISITLKSNGKTKNKQNNKEEIKAI